MSSGIKLSSSTPVLQTSNGEISSDGPVFTVTRSSRSHAALSSMPESAAGCDSATHGVGLYEPSSNINHSENGWYSMKSSASPPYFDQPQTIIDVESNLPNSKIDSGFSPQHDVDLTTVFVPHMVFSCLALWCCGCFLGCFGFLFAGNANKFNFSRACLRRLEKTVLPTG
jgi:hypothetical protein